MKKTKLGGNIYIPKGILLYQMVQKCTLLKVLEIFFLEPTNLHFIKSISKKINLAPTSVRNHLEYLLEQNLVLKKSSRPFDGYIANRESEIFINYKRAYNLCSVKEISDKIEDKIDIKAIILTGSYSFGEDIESSEIKLVIVSNSKKEIDLSEVEENLEREINYSIVNNINKEVQKQAINGIVIKGSL